MKRVLIIANLIHASPRIPGIATYLPEFGWKAEIVTPPISATDISGFPSKFSERVRVIEAPYRGDIFWFWRKILRLFGFTSKGSMVEQVKDRIGTGKQKSFADRLFTWYQTIFAYPDTEITWKKPAQDAVVKVLKESTFDAVISSSPFPTSHRIAAHIKSETNLPWLADFRDLWTQNHNYPFPAWRKKIETKMEIKLLGTANAMSTVVPALSEKQALLHKKKVIVIENGFDPENINIPPSDLTEQFTITYTGTIYTGKQNPAPLFEALSIFIAKQNLSQQDIEIRFYGTRQTWIDDSINKYNVKQFVHQYGTVSRNESIQKQRESHVLLLLNWEDPLEMGIYPSKLFEYFTARRPILATGGGHGAILESMLAETNTGIYAASVDEIVQALETLYNEYKINGKIIYNGREERIAGYSYRDKAKKFAEVLDTITHFVP